MKLSGENFTFTFRVRKNINQEGIGWRDGPAVFVVMHQQQMGQLYGCIFPYSRMVKPALFLIFEDILRMVKLCKPIFDVGLQV